MATATFKEPAFLGRYTAPAHPPDQVMLMDRETGHSRKFYVVDAREILSQPSTRYSPADDEARKILARTFKLKVENSNDS